MRTVAARLVAQCRILIIAFVLAVPASFVSGADRGTVDPSIEGSTESASEEVSDGGPYRVTAFRYEGLTAGIRPEQLDWERVRLAEVPNGLVAPRPDLRPVWLELGRVGGREGRGTALYASALREIPTAITRVFRRAGIGAVRVGLLRSEIDSLLDPASDGVLTIHITVGVVGVVAAKALVGETTLTEEETLADPVVGRIVRDSPVSEGDPVAVDRLRDYADALNRFRHRRVEIGIGPGTGENEVALDYLVSSVRPWTASLEVDNTGTPETGRFRERLGWLHRNLTGHDDALSVAFITAELDEANAGLASYEFPFRAAPLFSARCSGLYSEYDASQVGAFDLDFSGTAAVGGVDLRSNIFSSGSFFADAELGGAVHRIETNNETLRQEADATFAIARFGLVAEQTEAEQDWRASVDVEWSVSTLGSDRRDVVRLGRTDADDDWRRLRFDWSGAVNPFALFRPVDRAERSAHRIAWRVSAQDSLGTRLPPNFTLLSGGFRSVRGYPEAYTSGDRGIVASLEYRWHVARWLASSTERPAAESDWDLILRCFLDASRTEQQDRLTFERDVDLIGTGLGAELILRRRVRVRLDWGLSAREAHNGADRAAAGVSRWHFSLAVVF
ncbi:MAG: ShlB/FhaC/HecB family hemolysin secretion/activation protein [Planctomycetes bacterium]|nr:ShlB/FhaC/HecB family hemolysin secretion/activation protein [Planctomycetota bacterium]